MSVYGYSVYDHGNVYLGGVLCLSEYGRWGL